MNLDNVHSPRKVDNVHSPGNAIPAFLLSLWGAAAFHGADAKRTTKLEGLGTPGYQRELMPI